MDAITICLVLVALINLAPALGLVGAKKLTQTYQLSQLSGDLILLLRHRALLFGILGGFILYSAFTPMYHIAAMLMGFISIAAMSF